MTNQRLTIDENDAMLRYILRGGQARVFFCRTTQMTQQAADTHLASDVATAAMGRFLAGAAVLGAMEKEGQTSLTVTADGGGAGGKMTTVVRGNDLKITVDNPQAELPTLHGRQDVAGFVGTPGRLTVVRDFGAGEPYIGISALTTGELGDDFAHYFTVSEQAPSLVALGCLNQDGVVLSAGGIVIQAMPGCTDNTLTELENRTPFFAGISRELYDRSIDELAQAWFKGMELDLLSREPLRLVCDCSRDKMRAALISLGKEELNAIVQEGNETKMTCHFCRSRHTFDVDEVKDMLAHLQEGTH